MCIVPPGLCTSRLSVIPTVVVGALLLHAVLAHAQVGKGPIPPMAATRVSHAPVIDGSLDDEAWHGAPLPTTTWESYNPVYGDKIAQRTTVWAAYDKDAIYFAFKCDDPEPSRIKTSITRRDNIWADDWVGLSLDALGSGQTSYHLMVNPSGIQLDMINTISGSEDTSPDWVWQSAGRVTSEGYVVEIRLPLQTIRFNGGADVRMGILFWRRVSRIGVSVAWPALEPSKWVFEKHATLTFKDLTAVPTREVIPSVTLSRNQDRIEPNRWSSDNTGDLGVSAKYGITPTVTMDATVNPDFSQVESDAFQVEVNQRYPVFFSEKRPFFMEGAGLFNLAGNAQGDSSMLYAVHTRKIVDPIFGAKLTGTAGRVTFGTLTAIDQAPGRTDEETDPLHGKEQLFQVARAQLGLKAGSYAGTLLTLTNLDGRTNLVGGADLNLKINQTQRLTAFALGASTTGEREVANRSGVGTQINYFYDSRRVSAGGQLEHYGTGFVMDTAFLNRVGFTSGWLYGDYSFFPDKDKHPWIRRITPFTFIQGGSDRVQKGDEYISVTGLRLRFTRQGFFRIDQSFGKEPWHGQRFDQTRTRLFGEVQLFPWLRPYGNLIFGDATYYDDEAPFQGRSVSASAGATFQPNGRFTESVEYSRIGFDRKSTGERVYTIDIVNTRTTFQFTKEFSVRGDGASAVELRDGCH
jgi:Domain of unknown function (DUF5916)/Carbohydrate family 9 binding domain-like